MGVWVRRSAMRGMPLFGEVAYQFMHSVKAGVKDALSPQLLFTDLGVKYVGPVDGHDEHAVEAALRRARGFHGPVLVHVVTQKGRGYGPAEDDEGPAGGDANSGYETRSPVNS